jgi:DNA replication protein DnaC
MIIKQEINEQIENYCKELKLPAIRQNFIEDAQEANQKNYGYEEFLYYLLQKQSDLRRLCEHDALSRCLCVPLLHHSAYSGQQLQCLHDICSCCSRSFRCIYNGASRGTRKAA